jgi:hypothetical protein
MNSADACVQAAGVVEGHCTCRYAGRKRACENLFPHQNLLKVCGVTAESTIVLPSGLRCYSSTRPKITFTKRLRGPQGKPEITYRDQALMDVP